jgi:maleate isomerase
LSAALRAETDREKELVVDVHIIRRSAVQVAYDPEPADKRIGLIVLSTDHVLERDFARMCPAEVAIHATRIAYDNPTTPENLRRMQPRLAQAAALILPDEPLDAICYGCTSASMVLGDDKVISDVTKESPACRLQTRHSPPGWGSWALAASACSRPISPRPAPRSPVI